MQLDLHFFLQPLEVNIMHFLLSDFRRELLMVCSSERLDSHSYIFP